MVGDGDPPQQPAPVLLERRVPYEQQAVVQLKEVQQGAFYDWGALPAAAICRRLALVYVVFFAVGCAVASNTYTMPGEVAAVLLAGNVGGMLLTFLFMVRIYSGWNYVSERLGEAVLDYEESSWADGFMARKPEEVRARDQYLNEFTVKPVLAKLKPILGALAVLLVVSAVGLKVLGGNPDEQYSAAYLSRLSTDDKAAEAAAARAARSGKPAYCGDRYYKVIAGGSMCD